MDNSNTTAPGTAPQRLHYTHALCTVYFYDGEQVQILDTQFFSTSNQRDHFPAQRLNNIQNLAAKMIKDGQNPATPFQCLEVHIKTLNYLGEFTPEEFWKGMENAPGAQDAGVGAKGDAVAAVETVSPDNVLPFKPNGLADAVGTALDTDVAADTNAPTQDHADPA